MQTPVITRNGLDKTFEQDNFGKRSKDHAGTAFYTPVLKAPLVREIELDGKTQKVLTDIEDFIWGGVEDLTNSINTSLRRQFAEIYLDNVDEKTGVFNEEQWKIDAADFAAGVERLSAIEDKLDALAAEQVSIVDDPNFGEDNAENTALQERLKALNSRVKPLRVTRATIEAKYKARAEKRAARKAAELKAAGSKPVEANAEPVAA